MITVFKYKQKNIPKLFILFAMLFIPSVFAFSEAYSSVLFYMMIIILEIVAFVYYSSKSLSVTDKGIEVKIFWSIVSKSAKWEEMEEASVITGGGNTYQNSPNSIPSVTAYTAWVEKISLGTTIKIILLNREPFYIKLQDIKNSEELNKILLDKIKFEKY